MANPIIRTPTSEERKDFTPLSDKDPTKKFYDQLHAKKAEANKKALPFADVVAEAEWKDHFQNEAKRVLRQYGYAKAEAIKPLELDWDKYSDLDNFELIEEGETFDDYLSKRQNRQIFLKFKKYQFKGFSKKFLIQEPSEGAWNEQVSSVSNNSKEKVPKAKK